MIKHIETIPEKLRLKDIKRLKSKLKKIKRQKDFMKSNANIINQTSALVINKIVK